MSKMFVDVTQLVHWQGNMAGIPRVMYEISTRFTDTKNQTKVYVSWVKEVKAFCEIDFTATWRQRGKGIVYVKDQVEGTGSSTAAALSKKQFYTVLKPFKRLAKKLIVKAGLEDMAIVQRTQHSLAAAEAETYKKVEFTPGDALFISWGEWWDENFLSTLEVAVKESRLKIIPIIHDVLPFTLTPQFSGHSTESLMNYCRRIVPISALTLSVSYATQNDLKKWLKKQHIALPPMDVFRLGEDFEVKDPIMPTEKAFVDADVSRHDFLLTIGTIEAKKNHTLLYYVYKLAKSRGIDLPLLVIGGRRGWKTEQVYDFMTQDPEVKDKFVFLHEVSDENLSWLYTHAKLTVFPSFSEGWGMPIAESIARGTPCATSNTTSLPEVVDGYVKYFDPASTDECLAAISMLLEPKNQKKWRDKAATYVPTSWDESYAQVRSKMQEVAHV